MSHPPKPLTVRREGDDRLFIAWGDGRSGTVAFQRLRNACPCATCREVREQPPDPFKVLSAAEIQAGPPRPTAMAPVGYYAYKITWNDGHDSGIYTLESLRALTVPEA